MKRTAKETILRLILLLIGLVIAHLGLSHRKSPFFPGAFLLFDLVNIRQIDACNMEDCFNRKFLLLKNANHIAGIFY